MYLGGYVSQDIFNAVFTYFIVFALSGTAGRVQPDAGMYVAQLISVAIFIPLCFRFHPAPSYRIAIVLFAASLGLFLLLYRASPTTSGGSMCRCDRRSGARRTQLHSLERLQLHGGLDEIVTGRRREGAFAGVMTFIARQCSRSSS